MFCVPKQVSVPEHLRRAHPVVKATSAAAVGQRAGADGRIRIGPSAGLVHTVASRDILRRGLRIIQGLFDEVAQRGWVIEPFTEARYGQRSGVAVVVSGHPYPVELHEHTETLPFTDAEIAAWRGEWSSVDRSAKQPPPQRKRRRATGHLALVMPNGYDGGRTRWSDGSRGTLEGKLGSVVETLAQRARDDDERDVDHLRQQKEWQHVQERRRAEAHLQQVETAREKRVIDEANAFARAERVRRYVTAVRARFDALPGSERKRLSAWCDWADAWADRTDPVRSAEYIIGLDDERVGTSRTPDLRE